MELSKEDIFKIKQVLKDKYPDMDKFEYSSPFINSAHFLESIAQWRLEDFDFVFKLIKQIMYRNELLYIQRSMEYFINLYRNHMDNSKEEYWEKIALEELNILPYFIVESKVKGYNTKTNGIKYLCQKYKKEKEFEKVAELSKIAIILNLSDDTNSGYLGRLENAQKHCGNKTYDFNIRYTSKTLPKLLKNIKKNNKYNFELIKIKENVDDYIVIDIETTGLNLEYCEILQLSAIKYVNNEKTDVFDVLVKPYTTIPNYITEINGITNEMVANANSIDIELPKFLDFIKDAILIGHNIRFDITFITNFCAKLGIDYGKFKVIDTLYLARKNLQLENYKLETIGLSIGYDATYHRAVNDCLATNYVYQHIKKINQQP